MSGIVLISFSVLTHLILNIILMVENYFSHILPNEEMDCLHSE